MHQKRFEAGMGRATLGFLIAMAIALYPILDRPIRSIGDMENHLVRG